MSFRCTAAGIALIAALSCTAQAATLDAYWTLDNTTADSSGNGNTLHLNGSPSYGTGAVGGALDLTDGQSANTIAPPSFNLMASDFTISLWANFSSLDAGGASSLPNTLIAQDNGGGSQQKWVLYYDASDHSLGFHVNAGGPSYFDEASIGSSNPELNTWNMLTLTYNATTHGLNMYYNGSFIGGNGALFTSSPTADITLGIAEGIGQLHGALDDVRIYNGALSATEVSDLYSGTTTGVPEPGTWAMLFGAALCALAVPQNRVRAVRFFQSF